MEQITAFLLGVSIGAFVWVVVVTFRTSKLAKQNEESLRNVEEWISRNDEIINRRIDQEIDRVNNLHKDSISYIDSRADKLDSKFCSDGRALTERSREFLKG